MATYLATGQLPETWHYQGMFMGMHWAWWLFWIAAIVIVAWAFGRLALDRRTARREAARLRVIEDALRERHARGDIDEQELVRTLTDLLRAEPRRDG